MKVIDLEGGGASASLNKTISEVMKFMGDDGKRPNKGLRDFMYEKFGDLVEGWYKKGFNRGHREALEAWRTSGTVPTKLTYEGKRRLVPGPKRAISMNSTVPAKPRAKAKASRPKRK